MTSFAKSIALGILCSCLGTCALPSLRSQALGCSAQVRSTCSFTVVNSDCTIGIDRLRPVTPPTVNVRRGYQITVEIANPSIFEQLSLALKSATAQVPADSWQAAITALTPNLQKLTIPFVLGPRAAALTSQDQIKKQQGELMRALNRTSDNAALALALIKPATQAPPPDVCFQPDDPQSPWLHSDSWKTTVNASLDEAVKVYLPDGSYSFDTTAATGEIKKLQDQIDNLTKNGAGKGVTDPLNANQTKLTAALTAVDGALTKLAKLRKVIQAVPAQGDPAFLKKQTPKKISDLQAATTRDSQGKVTKIVLIDRNDQNEQWTVNFTNTLGPAVLSAVTDPGDAFSTTAADIKAGATPGTALVTIPALFQTPARLEVATSLLVPTQPYHGYASAANAVNGTVSGYVVQETLTYAVVPAAELNTVFRNWMVGGQRASFFGTFAIGYNNTSSAVEFGVGPSFSWKSILISGLADIGRDTQLADGFKVGQSLGTSGSAKPLTSTVWKVKPSVGIGVRIPLGSSGK